MEEFQFRLALVCLLLAFVAHRGYYTSRARRADAAVVEQPAPGRLSRIAGLLTVPALLSTLAYILNPTWMAWSALPLPIWLRWLGVGLALVGFVLLHWSQLSLGKNWSDHPRLLAGQEMVVHGPYRWIRHPIYAAFLLILESTLLITANWFIGLSWILMTGLDVAERIRTEEAMLQNQFGEPYQVYMQSTGRLFPRLLKHQGLE